MPNPSVPINTIPVLYLSRAIIRQKSDYYRLPLDVTIRGAWVDWIVFVNRRLLALLGPESHRVPGFGRG